MRIRVIPFLLALSIVAAAAAETPPGEDPLARHVFPPELVMKHQQEIGLTDRQRETIKGEIQKVQSKFLDLQFQMQKEMEKLVALLDGKPADESKTLAQADALMLLETETKKMHLAMLVRIKNLLTAEQQARLGRLREAAGKSD
jgi:Spy/CpxP family protein refolding chaperone